MLKRIIQINLALTFFVLHAEEPERIEVDINEQALVNYHRQEALWRRQIYRETSMRIKERRTKYQKDLERARKAKEKFAKELPVVESGNPVDLVELERVLNGSKAAERAIDISVEALLVIDTAESQFAKHRQLIGKSRERLRKALGAEQGHCALHRVKLDYVRVPVMKPTGDPTAEELLLRIRNCPVPAEPFYTTEAGNPGAPETIIIPACPKCTHAQQQLLPTKPAEKTTE
jgi:hypothetical protein